MMQTNNQLLIAHISSISSVRLMMTAVRWMMLMMMMMRLSTCQAWNAALHTHTRGVKCHSTMPWFWASYLTNHRYALRVIHPTWPVTGGVCTAHYSSYLTSHRWGTHCALFILPDQSQVGYALRVIHPTWPVTGKNYSLQDIVTHDVGLWCYSIGCITRCVLQCLDLCLKLTCFMWLLVADVTFAVLPPLLIAV